MPATASRSSARAASCKIATVAALVGDHTRSVNLVLGRPAPDAVFALPGVTILSSTGQDVHVMVRGDVNPLLRRLGELDVRDIAISTPDVEDLFFRYYEGTVAGSEGRRRDRWSHGHRRGGRPMIALSFRLELRRSRTLAVGLAVVVLVYGGLIAAIYPILLTNTTQIEDYMKLFPKEFMAAFGMTGNLADPGDLLQHLHRRASSGRWWPRSARSCSRRGRRPPTPSAGGPTSPSERR